MNYDREQHLKLAVDAVNERFEVAKALRQIALGECYSEWALTKAMSMCLLQEQAALVRRYLLGIQKSSDHVALQQLANEIEDRTVDLREKKQLQALILTAGACTSIQAPDPNDPCGGFWVVKTKEDTAKGKSLVLALIMMWRIQMQAHKAQGYPDEPELF